jgi:hypothetical protein
VQQPYSLSPPLLFGANTYAADEALQERLYAIET